MAVIKEYKYSTNSIEGFKFHDCHIDVVSQTKSNLYINLNHIDVLVDNELNPYEHPKQSDQALLILKDFRIDQVRKDFGTSTDSNGVKTVHGITMMDNSIIDINKLISDTEILSLERSEEYNNKLLFVVDPYKDYLIDIEISYCELQICWNKFIKDSWFAHRQK